MKGRPALFVCLLSGVALSFAFPEPSIAPLAWVAIAPLLVLGRAAPRKGFALGFAFGCGFFGALLIWVSVVGWVAWTVLVLLESSCLALFGLAWGYASKAGRAWWFIAAPALWVTIEVVREAIPVFGFPWGQLAQSQGVYPWLLQISQVGGGKTVSVVLLLVNVAICVAWLGEGSRRWISLGAAVATISVMAPLNHVIPQIDGEALSEPSEPIRIAIVQGNAAPGVEHEDERERVGRHLELTESLEGDDIDLVVWPESAVGIDPLVDSDVRSMIAEAARAVDAPMIVGANLDAGEDYKVTTLLVDPDGDIVDRYQKTHLVPFGEYVPAREALDWIPMLSQIPRDAVAGDDPKNFSIPVTTDHEVATVISFEGDFGHLVRDRVASGARLIVVATNTSTWERTWASAQHLAMSQVRAAENRVPVVHAALSGISAFVNFNGPVERRTDLYEPDVLISTTSPSGDISIYARTGEWLPILCLLASIAVVLMGVKRPDTVAG
jgi:apolipoprotein N-acyltransferase